MRFLQKMIPSSLGLALLFVGGVAQAELVVYEFTATITGDDDPNNELNVGTDAGQNSTITGTFSYDTTGWEQSGRSRFSYTSALETDQITTIGRDDYPTNITIRNSDVDGDDFRLASRALSLDGLSDGWEFIILEDGDISYGTSYGTVSQTLSLDDFGTAQYVVVGKDASGESRSLYSTITSLTKVETSSVPELSERGMATSVGLLIGAAFILTSRRRLGEIAQG